MELSSDLLPKQVDGPSGVDPRRVAVEVPGWGGAGELSMQSVANGGDIPGNGLKLPVLAL